VPNEESIVPAESPLSLLQGGASSCVWELDPGTSVLEFRVKHFWGAMTVRGRFGTVAGRFDVDVAGTASGSVEAAAASLDSGNARRDKHLRSADFFDVANHPSVVFSLAQIHPLGNDQVRVTGHLRAAGRSQPITFDAQLSDITEERVTVDGELSVDRRTGFGMNWSPLGMASSTAVLVVHAQFARSAKKS
jgi:polyisoprenoid-binding protein YceI